MSGFYDLMLMLDPTAPEERRTAVISETESMINSGGELVTNDDWGTRRMAYEIDHRPEAEYRLYQFNGDNTLLERLNQRLRITDAVLRFRIIKVKPGQPTPRRRTCRPRVAATTASPRTPRWPPARPPTRPPWTRRWRDAPPADAPPADAASAAVRRGTARRGTAGRGTSGRGSGRGPAAGARRRPPTLRPPKTPSSAQARSLRNAFAKDPALFGNFRVCAPDASERVCTLDRHNTA